MEPFLAVGFGALVAAGTYMTLSRHLLRMVLGLSLLAVGVNLLLFLSGRVGPEIPAFVDTATGLVPPGSANPLPQALVLTAVVIGFSLLAFALVLAYRVRDSLGTLDTDEMREAEAPDAPPAPKPDAPAASGAEGAR
ncbi:MAG: NADH-quinone oxidoreductase subunit K [Pseudomonadota bacterium]